MRKVIAVDFDGTLCTRNWPKIGEPNTELIRQLAEEQKSGAAVILFTCREGKLLKEAVKWCREQGLIFDEVNRNLKERIRAYRGDSRKISADVYVDDRAAAFSFGEKLRLGGNEDAGEDGQRIPED